MQRLCTLNTQLSCTARLHGPQLLCPGVAAVQQQQLTLIRAVNSRLLSRRSHSNSSWLVAASPTATAATVTDGREAYRSPAPKHKQHANGSKAAVQQQQRHNPQQEGVTSSSSSSINTGSKKRRHKDGGSGSNSSSDKGPTGASSSKGSAAGNAKPLKKLKKSPRPPAVTTSVSSSKKGSSKGGKSSVESSSSEGSSQHQGKGSMPMVAGSLTPVATTSSSRPGSSAKPSSSKPGGSSMPSSSKKKKQRAPAAAKQQDGSSGSSSGSSSANSVGISRQARQSSSTGKGNSGSLDSNSSSSVDGGAAPSASQSSQGSKSSSTGGGSSSKEKQQPGGDKKHSSSSSSSSSNGGSSNSSGGGSSDPQSSSSSMRESADTDRNTPRTSSKPNFSSSSSSSSGSGSRGAKKAITWRSSSSISKQLVAAGKPAVRLKPSSANHGAALRNIRDKTFQQLQQLVAQHGSTTSLSDLSAMFSRLKVVPWDHQADKAALLDQLWALLQLRLDSIRPRHCAEAMLTASKLQHSPGSPDKGPEGPSGCSSERPQAKGLVTVRPGQAGPDQAGPDQAGELYSQCLAAFVRGLRDQAGPEAGAEAARLLANVVYALGTAPSDSMHKEYKAVVEGTLLPEFMKVAGEARPQSVSNTVYAAALLGCSSLNMQRLLAVVQKGLWQRATTQELSNTLWATATLGQQLPVAQLQHMLEAFLAKLDDAKPQHICNTLWAFASLGQRMPDAQLARLVAAQLRKRPCARSLSGTLWSVAKLGQQLPQQQVDQFVALLAQQVTKELFQNGRKPSAPAAAAAGPGAQSSQLVPSSRMIPQALSNSLWAVAVMKRSVSQKHVDQLLSGLVQQLSLPETNPQCIANSLWACATIKSSVNTSDLVRIFAAFTAKLPAAEPQAVANALYAAGCLHPPFLPKRLLAQDSIQYIQDTLLPNMKPQELSNIALACGMLGHLDRDLLVLLVNRAVLLAEASRSNPTAPAFDTQGLCNLCWACAVLDLQEASQQLQLLAKEAVGLWQAGSMVTEDRVQLYQLHMWLMDVGAAGGGGAEGGVDGGAEGGAVQQWQQQQAVVAEVAAAGGSSRGGAAGGAEGGAERQQASGQGQGLLGHLTEQQLSECRAAWMQMVDTMSKASQMQGNVFEAVQQLPRLSNVQLETRTPDGLLSVDIQATAEGGQQVAIEVDGPWHFRRPDRGLTGPTLYRDRALAVRGYVVVSVPWWQWTDLEDMESKLKYLEDKVQKALATASGTSTGH